MGFMSGLKKMFKTGARGIYNKVTGGIRTGYNKLHWLTNSASKSAHWIDNLLASASHVPVLQDVINLVRDNPVYAEVLGGIDSINSTVEDIGQLGSDVDSLIRQGLGFNQQQIHASNPANTSVSFTPSFSAVPRQQQQVAPSLLAIS